MALMFESKRLVSVKVNRWLGDRAMAYLYSYSSIDQLHRVCGRFGGMSKQIVRNESSCLYTGAFTTKSRSQNQHIYTKQHKFPLHHLRCAAAKTTSLPSGNMSAQNKDFSVCRMEVINMRSASTKRKIRISLTVFTNRVKPQRFQSKYARTAFQEGENGSQRTLR